MNTNKQFAMKFGEHITSKIFFNINLTIFYTGDFRRLVDNAGEAGQFDLV